MNNLPASGDPRLELLLAMRSCHPDWMTTARVTFRADSSVEAWQKDVFQAVLRPQLEDAWAACARRDARAWQAADRGIDEILPKDLAERSRQAGHLLATSFRPPAAEKMWVRQVTEIAEGRQPGHLASVMALRGATFSLSPRVTVGCYLLVEARGAYGLDAENLWWDFVDTGLAAGPVGAPAIRVA